MLAPRPKVKAWRSIPYRRFVAGQACEHCGIEGISQAAHENIGKGMALKVDDRRITSLCGTQPMRMGCHDQFDTGVEMTRDRKRELLAMYIERTLAKARIAGWPV